jgi:hypothetical protein
MSSTDSSSDEDTTNIAVTKGLLFPPNVDHKCLMAKDGKKKKVQARTTPSILHLVMMNIICLPFLPTLTCNKKKN